MLPALSVEMMPVVAMVVEMFPALVVEMLPANAVEVMAKVKTDVQRSNWKRFIVVLLVNRTFAGDWSGSSGVVALEKLPILGPTVNK
jgi:hypothetical protein